MISLTKKQAEQLISHSIKGSPYEVCGILAGQFGPEKERVVKKIYEMVNTDKSHESFFMDAKEQLRVMKEMRNLSLEMVGIYHSHPHTPAHPSAEDVKLAYYPEVSYIIISLSDLGNPQIKSFRIGEGKIEEESVSHTV